MPETPGAALACRLDALGKDGRERHGRLAAELLAAVASLEELPDGFVFRFPARPYLFLRVAEWVELERACCPFFEISIDFESGARQIRVSVTGPEGAKEVLRSELPGLAAASTSR